MKVNSLNIGILGLGKMGSAIAAGLLQNGMSVMGYDITFETNEGMPKPEGIQPTGGILQLEEASDILILSVKPQDLASVCKKLKGNKKYISVAAGVTVDTLSDYISSSNIKHIARVMPNLAAEIHKSVTGVYSSDAELRTIAVEIFSKIGSVTVFPKEESLHAVTALAGSGPAFVFTFINAMAEGGVLAGIPYDQSLAMAIDTVLGSAEYLKKSGKHPAALRNAVASPAGTTITGLEVLESGSFSGTVMKAVKSAADRSRELGS